MKPKNFLLRMFLFLLIISSAVFFIFPVLMKAFMANVVVNSLIVFCLLFGIFFVFRQVYILVPEAKWLEDCKNDLDPPFYTPKLLAPLVNVLKESNSSSMSTLSMRSLIDGVDARLDDSREISRFFPGLLVFLGLLGTFWGLIQTVSSIADVISGISFSSLSSSEDGAVQFFEQLKTGLKAPLSGMGLAFSASMFGLAGSLILSFLDLQAGQAYRHFSRDLEEWLSTLTRLPLSVTDNDRVAGGSGYLMALLENTNETMNGLFRLMKETEDSRISVNKTMVSVAEKVGKLTDQMKTEQTLMIKIAEAQIDLHETLKNFSEGLKQGGLDDSTKSNLRNLEAITSKVLEEMTIGRKQVVDNIRDEIRLLSKTISNLAQGDA